MSGIRKLHPLQQFGYDYTRKLLALSVDAELLSQDKIKNICDFGTGTGGPILALKDVFKIPETNLTLLETYPPQAAQLQKLLPTAKVQLTDGVEWLTHYRGSFDLITAFMLGPDYYNDGFAAAFIKQALCRLSPAGKLLICSDVATMTVVQQFLSNIPAIACHWLLEENIPITVIVKKVKRNQAIQAKAMLPKSMIISASIPDAKGHWELEEYCLSRPFEKNYLKATIEAFKAEMPEHPGILPMQEILNSFH